MIDFGAATRQRQELEQALHEAGWQLASFSEIRSGQWQWIEVEISPGEKVLYRCVKRSTING